MVRTEALKKAQKKYLEKIKEENGERYQKYLECMKKYQKKSFQKLKDNPVLYEMALKRNREYQRHYYKNYKEKKLDQAKRYNDKKREQFLLNLKELEEDLENIII